jgi:hypothetical protein
MRLGDLTANGQAKPRVAMHPASGFVSMEIRT